MYVCIYVHAYYMFLENVRMCLFPIGSQLCLGQTPPLLSKRTDLHPPSRQVVDGAGGREVQLINRKSLRSLTCQLLALLMAERKSVV